MTFVLFPREYKIFYSLGQWWLHYIYI